MNVHIGERIKSTRKMLGISQQELSKLSGISQQIISRLESKKAEGTTSIVGLANALQVTPEWLQTGKESRLKPLSVPTVTNYDDIDIPHLDVQVDLAITDETRTALAKLISSYKNAGDAKKASMQMLVALPEHEMSTMLLLLKSLSDKYKDAP